MKHYIIWHDNGDAKRTASNCGYSEEFSEKTSDEIRAEYQALGCRVFEIEELRA